ncbi:MAG: DUF3341 domain-containing protein [Deltaproteobacteria bacterium]|nr:DUF3341 domain-containing protein [Deltaproteobacteria bacterium]
MSARLLYASFGDETALLAATAEARRLGVAIHDAYTPHPVHGLDEAMGLRRSRLPWICFTGGAVGLGLASLMQWWMSAVDWPLVIGGKPFGSWPAFAPVMFETMVLLAGLSTAFALFLRSRLRPRISAPAVPPRATQDRYVLALAERDGSFDRREVMSLLHRHGALSIQEGDT